jgi:hypothetical protein
MRCPECKKYSKEIKTTEKNGSTNIYSECKKCGKILVDKIQRENSRVDKKTEFMKPSSMLINEDVEIELEHTTGSMKALREYARRTDAVKILLVVFSVFTACVTGYFFSGTTQDQRVIKDIQVSYLDLYDRYLTLEKNFSITNRYYNEITEMYTNLRDEYSEFTKGYVNISREKNTLQNEVAVFEEIINFEKYIIFESNRIVELPPQGNATLLYETNYAGFLEVNFTASTDIFLWIGSSINKEIYFARFPTFPNTAVNGSFKIPVCSTVYINISNPNEENDVDVRLSVKYTY